MYGIHIGKSGNETKKRESALVGGVNFQIIHIGLEEEKKIIIMSQKVRSNGAK